MTAPVLSVHTGVMTANCPGTTREVGWPAGRLFTTVTVRVVSGAVTVMTGPGTRTMLSFRRGTPTPERTPRPG